MSRKELIHRLILRRNVEHRSSLGIALPWERRRSGADAGNHQVVAGCNNDQHRYEPREQAIIELHALHQQVNHVGLARQRFISAHDQDIIDQMQRVVRGMLQSVVTSARRIRSTIFWRRVTSRDRSTGAILSPTKAARPSMGCFGGFSLWL